MNVEVDSEVDSSETPSEWCRMSHDMLAASTRLLSYTYITLYIIDTSTGSVRREKERDRRSFF